MKDNIKAFLVFNLVIFIICYLVSVIINEAEWGFNLLISGIISLSVDLCLLIESIRVLKSFLNILKRICYMITSLVFITAIFTPIEIPDCFIVSIVLSIFFCIYDTIFNSNLEYNTSKSAQHPTSEGENVRWTYRKLWEHKDKKPYG